MRSQRKKVIVSSDEEDVEVNKKMKKRSKKQIQKMIEESSESDKKKSKKSKKNKKDDDDDFVVNDKMEEESSSSDHDLVKSSFSEVDEEEITEKKKKKRLTKSSNKKSSKGGRNKHKILSSNIDTDKKDQNEENEDIVFADEGQIELLTQDDIDWPKFLQPDQIRDANQNLIGSENYDESTLHIPESYLKNETPVFRQYWLLKKQNFDKILFFKFGSHFMAFYHDAFVMQKVFNHSVRKWGKRPFNNIWGSQHKVFIQGLIEHGYKVAIADQLEYESNKNENDIIKRELTQIITKGTFIEYDEKDYNQKWMVCITQIQGSKMYGLCAYDCTIQECYLDEFEDDETHINLRTILQQLQPVEVIYQSNGISPNILQIVKQICNPVITKLDVQFTEIQDLFDRLNEMFSENNFQLPILIQDLQKIYENDKNEINNKFVQNLNISDSQQNDDTKISNYMLLQSLHISIQYLKRNLIDHIIYISNYKLLDINIEKSRSLILDANTLSNLDIFQVNYITHLSPKGSLFEYIDYTATQYGSRLLKKWLQSPLYNIQHIKDRQIAIEDIMTNIDLFSSFQQKITQLKDLERNVGHILNGMQKSRMNQRSHDSFTEKGIEELQQVLLRMSKIEDIISIFEDYVGNFKSQRLRSICSFKENKIPEEETKNTGKKYKSYAQQVSSKKKQKQGEQVGLFPRLNVVINELKDSVEIDPETKMIIPKAAESDDQYSEGIKNLRNLQQIMNNELQKWKNYFQSQEVKFYHTKQRYQIQVPESVLQKSKFPSEFTVISKTTTARRFYTSVVEQTLYSIREQEILNAEYLIPFIDQYLRKFYSHKNLWYQAISCLSELDCYISLARCSLNMGDVICKPQFVKDGIFDLKEMYHPCLIKAGIDMTPNDTVFQNNINAFLITGPNMGGKSTLLRQTCLAVILAQLGCYIPAKQFILTPIDRIFCRIGATDKPFEGKSTFHVEMEETLTIINDCTENSLCIFDELGRGTSTFDGVAIAYGVLKYLVEEKKCKTLFTTHYHILLDEFRLFKNIEYYMMNYQVEDQNKKIKFLYKFIKGETYHSFGINVAKIAGIPKSIVMLAEKKEQEMDSEKERLGEIRQTTREFNKAIQSIIDDDILNFK